MALDLRPSPIAGLWYEGDRKALARSVDMYLDGAQLPELKGKMIAVVGPHAGHRYSGPVAGYSFAAVRGAKPDLVAVLSPFHNFHSAPLLTTAHEAYATPLGAVPIDREAVTALETGLEGEAGLGLTRISNDPEHSLEIMLPFLQRALASEWKLLPLMVRAQDVEFLPTARIAAREDPQEPECPLGGQHGPFALPRAADSPYARPSDAVPGGVLRP